jgi:hypothetical protein
MAETLNSHEIEDVLSSIRRLVAQDLKSTDQPKSVDAPEVSLKLVLAPENRVEDKAAGVQAKFASIRRPRRVAFPAIDEVLNSVEGGTAGAASVPHFDLGANQAETFVAPQRNDAVIDPDARMSDIAPEQFFDENQNDDGAAHFTNDAEPEPDEWEQSSEAENFEYQAPPEVFDAAVSGTIEPDSAWADAAEAQALAEIAGESVQPPFVDRAQTTFDEPNFGPAPKFTTIEDATAIDAVDEEALRLLVQTIFREEMAGAMGERITRNIRKLVRAEVNRMLAAQELD